MHIHNHEGLNIMLPHKLRNRHFPYGFTVLNVIILMAEMVDQENISKFGAGFGFYGNLQNGFHLILLLKIKFYKDR